MQFSRDYTTQIIFDLNVDDSDLDDELAFLVLLERKFGGDLEYLGVSLRGDGVNRATFRLRFDDYAIASEARAHCYNCLEGECIHKHYRGALDRADPGRYEAKRLRDQVDDEMRQTD